VTGTAGWLRVEATDQHGTVWEIIPPDALGRLAARKRAALGELANAAVRDLAAEMGTDEDHARKVLVTEIMRQRADEAAYERVCERRGVLPL